MVEVFSNAGLEEMGINFKDMLGGLFPKGMKRRRLKVPEALEALAQEEAQNLVDLDRVVRRSIEKVEQSGIIFIDEIDKIVAKNGSLPRAGRLARGGAAGPAAGGRGLHSDDQARPGQDRPHPVHRLGRLSHGRSPPT